jgi:hypothetical protein
MICGLFLLQTVTALAHLRAAVLYIMHRTMLIYVVMNYGLFLLQTITALAHLRAAVLYIM